jgi:ATP-dependent Zn protease
MNSKAKRLILFTVLVVVAASLAMLVGDRRQAKATYTEFLQQVQAGQVSNATIVAAQTGADEVDYKLKSGVRLQTIAPRDYREAVAAMRQKLVNIEIRNAWWQPLSVLVNSSPFLILLGFWFYMMRKLRNHPHPQS